MDSGATTPYDDVGEEYSIREKSYAMVYIDKAIQEKHAAIKQDGKYQKITYIAAHVTERYDDPEEKVRAEFWAELIYRYQYDPQQTLSARAKFIVGVTKRPDQS